MTLSSSRPAGAKCLFCGSPMTPGMVQCRNAKCRQFNLASSSASVEESTVLLSDATLGNVERIKTGLVDTVFGGGIVRTSVNLLGGDPGAGKTTLCLQIADIVCDQFPKKEALYIANEQDAAELKGTALRLQLRHLNRIRVVKAMGGIPHDLGDLIMRFEPAIVFLDSVTKWSGEDLELAVIVCQRLKDYTVKLNAPTIVVNQVTKDGDHAGLNKMQHAVDWCGLFEVEPSEEGQPLSPDSPRRLGSTKNRFGPAPEEQWYQMTETGLVEYAQE
jgi:DNA repair protein RadA/Sms